MKKENQEPKIKRFLECLVPVTACNLQCSYCYIIQRNKREMKIPKTQYSPEYIGKALSKERLGGTCYISICGAGETLIPKDIVEIVKEIIMQGHFVNITTNGTLTKKFKELMEIIPKDHLERLHFSFSFHYLELKRLKLVDIFFDNIALVKEMGCSFMVQINLCDEYIPYLEEIKSICLKKVGAYPQVAVTRKEDGLDNIELLTEKSSEEYRKIGESFHSPLFAYTMQNFMVPRKEFCYAGERTGVLNLYTGILEKCYGDPFPQNIYKDLTKKIHFEAIGTHCYSKYCLNSSHFMSMGVFNDQKEVSYCSLRDRQEADWFNSATKKFLTDKLYNNNCEYSSFHKITVNIKGFIIQIWIVIKKTEVFKKIKPQLKRIIRMNKNGKK